MKRGGTLEQARAAVRKLGRMTEWRVLEGLLEAGIQARHATEEEDISGWDLEITFRGITARVDITISKGRFEEKRSSDQCQSGLIIPVLVDASATTRKLAEETMGQIIHSLNGSLILNLVRE